MLRNLDNYILLFIGFLAIILANFIRDVYPAVYILSSILLMLLLLNVFYGWYNHPIETNQFIKFKEKNGFNHTVKTSGSSRTYFLDGNNKPDEYISFVKDFLLISFRKSSLKYTKINRRYEIYCDENYCIVQDNENFSLTLLKNENIL